MSFKNEINENIIPNFLRHGYIPSPYTIYKNVNKLEPGKLLEISEKKFSPLIKSFWNLPKIIKQRSIYNNYTDMRN